MILAVTFNKLNLCHSQLLNKEPGAAEGDKCLFIGISKNNALSGSA